MSKINLIGIFLWVVFFLQNTTPTCGITTKVEKNTPFDSILTSTTYGILLPEKKTDTGIISAINPHSSQNTKGLSSQQRYFQDFKRNKKHNSVSITRLNSNTKKNHTNTTQPLFNGDWRHYPF